METHRLVLIACVVLYTAVAAVVDWRIKKLPNVMTVTSLAAAMLFHLVSGALSNGWTGVGSQLLFSLGGFSTGFGILLAMWLMGSGGGGDVKYMGALGAWIGARLTLQVFLVGAVLVALGSAVMLAIEFARMGLGKAKQRYLTPREDSSEKTRVRRRVLPFGVPAMLATWLVLVVSELTLKG